METLGELLCCCAGFWLRNQEFPLPLLPRQQLLWLSVSTKGEKLCVLSTGGVSLTCCLLVPEHRWPQGAWQLRPLGNHRKQLCLKSSAWQRAQSNLPCCLSHLSEGSCNENKQLSIMLCIHLEIMKTSTRQPRSPSEVCVTVACSHAVTSLLWSRVHSDTTICRKVLLAPQTTEC